MTKLLAGAEISRSCRNLAVVVFPFQRHAAGTAWEITTMFVEPGRRAES